MAPLRSPAKRPRQTQGALAVAPSRDYGWEVSLVERLPEVLGLGMGMEAWGEVLGQTHLVALECDEALQLRDLPPAGFSASFKITRTLNPTLDPALDPAEMSGQFSAGFGVLVFHGCKGLFWGCHGSGIRARCLNRDFGFGDLGLRVQGFGFGVRKFWLLF